MPIPSLMDRLKKPKGSTNKVPTMGKPPAMPQPQMNATASGSPAPGMTPPKAPGGPSAGGAPKQPKAAQANPTPGVNAEMNGIMPKNGRPSKMSKADLAEILLVKGSYKLPAASSSSTAPKGSPVKVPKPAKEKGSQKNVMAAIRKIPIHPDHEKVRNVKEKDIISEKVVNPDQETTAKESAKTTSARQKASASEVTKPSGPPKMTATPKTATPEIGVKAPYKAPAQFSMTRFLTHVANPGSAIVNKIAHAAKVATLGKSEFLTKTEDDGSAARMATDATEKYHPSQFKNGYSRKDHVNAFNAHKKAFDAHDAASKKPGISKQKQDFHNDSKFGHQEKMAGHYEHANKLGKSETVCDPMVILIRKKIPSRRITPIQPKPPREPPIPEIPAQDVLVAVPLLKSAQDHVHQYVKDLKRRSGTSVLPKPVDPHAEAVTKVTNGSKIPSLEAEYQQRVEAKHDPKLTAKRNKIMAQTQTALAHKNKSSKDPGIAAFGRSQWNAIPAKDRLHHHLTGLINSAKNKMRGY